MDFSNEKIENKNSLYTDFRAEFVAACLIEGGMNSDEVRIIREGLTRRGKSVDKINWEYSYDRFSKYLTLYSKKRDLYESLPEGIFHRRMDINDKKNKDAVIDSFRHGNQEALSAAFFFRPFEMSIDRMQVEANLYEMHLEKREKHDDFIRLLDSFWPLLKTLSLDQALFAVSVFSQAYRLTQPEQVAEVLSVLLNCKVEINLSYKTLSIRSAQCDWTLGKNKLGITSVLGGEVSDYFPVMNVQINELPARNKDLLFKHSAAYKQFMNIMDLFVPADTELNISINVAKEGIAFKLAEENASDAPILGFSTVLS